MNKQHKVDQGAAHNVQSSTEKVAYYYNVLHNSKVCVLRKVLAEWSFPIYGNKQQLIARAYFSLLKRLKDAETTQTEVDLGMHFTEEEEDYATRFRNKTSWPFPPEISEVKELIENARRQGNAACVKSRERMKRSVDCDGTCSESPSKRRKNSSSKVAVDKRPEMAQQSCRNNSLSLKERSTAPTSSQKAKQSKEHDNITVESKTEGSGAKSLSMMEEIKQIKANIRQEEKNGDDTDEDVVRMLKKLLKKRLNQFEEFIDKE